MTLGWLICLFRGHKTKWSQTLPLLLWCPRCGYVHLDTSKRTQ